MWLAELLAKRDDIEGLRARADTGDPFAAERLANLLAKRDDIEEAITLLRAQADTGDHFAAERLAELLTDRGDIDGLRVEVLRGNGSAVRRLLDVLARQHPAVAERLRTHGLNPDGGIPWKGSDAPPQST